MFIRNFVVDIQTKNVKKYFDMLCGLRERERERDRERESNGKYISEIQIEKRKKTEFIKF